MESQELHEQIRDREISADIINDMTPSGLPIDYGLSHLTYSDKVMQFLTHYRILNPLIPLADQIMATQYFTPRQVAEYRMRLDDIILSIMFDMDEDQEFGHRILETAQIYLRALIDGNLKGYRMKAVTESRKVYTTEYQDQQEKKGWFRR